MKIIQIITLGHEFYGAQSHVLNLSEEMRNRGHDVLVLVGTEGELTDRLNDRNIRYEHVVNMVHPISPLKDIQAVMDINEIIRTMQPDIVATHSSKAGIVGRVAAWLCKTPSTFTAHGWSFADGVPENQRKIALFLEKVTAKLSNRIIAVANSEREFGLQNNVADPKKIVTIHYGTEDNFEQYSPKPILEPDASRPVKLLMVAGFRKQKDHPTLLNALVQLQHLPWTLSLLGDGELRLTIEKLVKDLGLTDRVTFHGAVNNVSDFLYESDLLVLTTNWEGLPISTIEGLSFGLPVIATAVAGTREQVIDGHNGITLDRGNVEQARTALETLISQPELRSEYGANSRQLFENQFTLSSMVGKTLDAYNEVLKDHPELSQEARIELQAENARKRRARRSMVKFSALGWFCLDLFIALIMTRIAFILSPYNTGTEYDLSLFTPGLPLVAFAFGAATAVYANILGLHETTLNARFGALVNRCIMAALGSVLTISALLLFVQFETLGRYVLIFSFILIAAGLVFARAVQFLFATQNKARVAFLGSPEFEKRARQEIKEDLWLSYHFQPEPLPADIDENSNKLITSGISELVIDERDAETLQSADLSDYSENGIRVTSYTDFIEYNKQFIPLDHINTRWMIQAQLDRAHPFYNSLKRIFDIMVSGTVLLLASPIILILILLVRLDSRGYPIYSQKRVGQFGSQFNIYKIRSMTLDAEATGAQWAAVNDSRVTKIGTVLRKWRLDELPQLWNVLVGDMSLVGPRPERPVFVEMLQKDIDFYSQRHLVKPGVTGWAQINYPYGASIEDSKRKLSYDLYYAKNLSWFLDFNILLRTIGTLAAGSR